MLRFDLANPEVKILDVIYIAIMFFSRLDDV